MKQVYCNQAVLVVVVQSDSLAIGHLACFQSQQQHTCVAGVWEALRGLAAEGAAWAPRVRRPQRWPVRSRVGSGVFLSAAVSTLALLAQETWGGGRL